MLQSAGGLGPAGKPQDICWQELMEEVGGTAAGLRYVGWFYTSNGLSNEFGYVYLVSGVEPGEMQPEPTELMKMRTVAEALSMAREGEITDSPSAPALLRYESPLPPLRQRIPASGVPDH